MGFKARLLHIKFICSCASTSIVAEMWHEESNCCWIDLWDGKCRCAVWGVAYRTSTVLHCVLMSWSLPGLFQVASFPSLALCLSITALLWFRWHWVIKTSGSWSYSPDDILGCLAVCIRWQECVLETKGRRSSKHWWATEFACSASTTTLGLPVALPASRCNGWWFN